MARLLEDHKERSRALAQRRQQIMQDQANVLRGYVMAGFQLPVRHVRRWVGPSGGACCSHGSRRLRAAHRLQHAAAS
jgi:hypothetical protein